MVKIDSLDKDSLEQPASASASESVKPFEARDQEGGQMGAAECEHCQTL
jgi:hypothetical protein